MAQIVKIVMNLFRVERDPPNDFPDAKVRVYRGIWIDGEPSEELIREADLFSSIQIDGKYCRIADASNNEVLSALVG